MCASRFYRAATGADGESGADLGLEKPTHGGLGLKALYCTRALPEAPTRGPGQGVYVPRVVRRPFKAAIPSPPCLHSLQANGWEMWFPPHLSKRFCVRLHASKHKCLAPLAQGAEKSWVTAERR